MSVNLYCFGTLNLYNAKGQFIKRDVVEVPLLQTPTLVTEQVLKNNPDEYFNWVITSYAHDKAFAIKHCKRVRKQLKDLSSKGYGITWSSS